MAVIGSIIDGKYEILKQIGKGGMSVVYLAMDKNLNKQWAIKEIKKQARNKNNEVVIQSAIAEANMMKRLDHPCLPRIVDIINREEVIYVVMDYIEGEPLNKILEQYGPQPQEIIIEWAGDLCDVLDYLHTQEPPIIYRDMKPANIMLQPNGNIKLIDFGIAREYKEHNLEDTVCLGTKGYAAPEQFGGRGQTDRRTDIYCLGVTLYHLLTGKNPSEPPYEIYPIRHWNAELSAGLEAIILKCTQLNPDDRYDSCAELTYALQHYEEADETHRIRQKKKLNYFISSSVICVMFLVLGITALLLRNIEDNSQFENYILQAETEPMADEKAIYYVRAIEIKPERLDTYMSLIDTYKDDATFTLEEEAQLKKVISANLVLLRQEEEYGALAFEVGKLYWYYYDYAQSDTQNNQITRMKSSIQWFEDAYQYGEDTSDYKTLAGIYRDIGIFYKDITLNVEEASDAGTYRPFYEQLKVLFTTTIREENEMISLEVYRLCMNSIENYAQKFQIDGVPKEDIEEFYTDVMNAVVAMNVSTEKTRNIKEGILEREESVEASIHNAYIEEE